MKEIKLNDAQQEAVSHVDGPMLVLAGAGSGKTRVVTERIRRLIELGIPYHQIVAVTFTNKAAKEMCDRIHEKCFLSPMTTTFHSLGKKILREFIDLLGYSQNFTIYDEKEAETLRKKILEEASIQPESSICHDFSSFISERKNSLTFFDATTLLPSQKQWHTLALSYQQKLKDMNAVDFDDLLFLTNLVLDKGAAIETLRTRWEYFLIDEYQDTNHAQYQMIVKLVTPKNNIFAVGDPDQSIYSWRGAQVENILRFETDFPGSRVISLEMNYRSTTEILEKANLLINNNSRKYEKHLQSHLGSGDPIELLSFDTDKEEVRWIVNCAQKLRRVHPEEEIAILYRTHSQSRLFEDTLLEKNVSYTIYGGISFYQRKEIKDLMSYFKCALSPFDMISFERALSVPKRGIGKKSMEKITSFSERKRISLHEILQNASSLGKEMGLTPAITEKLSQFYDIIHSIQEMFTEKKPVHEIAELLLTKSQYMDYLKSDTQTYEERKDNVSEFISKCFDWQNSNEDQNLLDFLEDITLSSQVDTQDGEKGVYLMTLHNAKGLEFDACFICALEEDILPHFRAKDSLHDLEEERRLLYVGMTRAKKRLFMTHARFRYLWGHLKPMIASRFIKEAFPKDAPNSPMIHEFLEGDRVRHPTFGTGLIHQILKTSHGTALKIQFSDGSHRTLVTKFAKLQKL